MNIHSAQKTIPCPLRDYYEWHQGRSHYGFWGLEIQDPEWISFIKSAEQQVRHWIQPGYLRAPHITIFPCGFLDPRHFSQELLNRQRQILEASALKPFSLHLKTPPIDTFLTAHFLAIENPENRLKQIRNLLSSESKEDHPPPVFTPHITLGFYRDSFDLSEVRLALSSFDSNLPPPLPITELLFCSYQTHEVQGPYQIQARVILKN